jgi:lipopolysaccharide biosynthesis glycosyltransferase
MNPKVLYACYASSNLYARETGISMIGFFENNPDYSPDEIFILDYGILPENKIKLNRIATQYSKRILYLPAKNILEDIQQKLNLKDFRGSLATYSRAFIDKIIPDYVERLLYIDSDTVVTDSIKDLKKFDMKESCIAACIMERLSTDIKKRQLILYSRNSRYYGCGIVLFDLYKWREQDCFSKIIKMIDTKKNYPCADQTLINNSLPESYFCKLPRKYNYTTHLFSEKVELYMLSKDHWNTHEEIEEVIQKPAIIHYPGLNSGRPWFVNCTSRRTEEYLKYKEISPWKNDPLEESKPCSLSLPLLFAKFINSLEVKPNMIWLLLVINSIRSLIGPLLRSIGLLPSLPPEGIE